MGARSVNPKGVVLVGPGPYGLVCQWCWGRFTGHLVAYLYRLGVWACRVMQSHVQGHAVLGLTVECICQNWDFSMQKMAQWTAGPDVHGGYGSIWGSAEDIGYHSRGRKAEQIG